MGTTEPVGLWDDQASELDLEAYDYPLPEHLIARYPLEQRDQSRMLLLDRRIEMVEHRHFFQLTEQLQPGDVLVLNNTKVLPARLLGHRVGHTGVVEVFLLYPSAEDPMVWAALTRPARKLKPGTLVTFDGTDSQIEILAQKGRGQAMVRVRLAEFTDVAQMMQAVGRMPIPPYLNREAEEQDKKTYQTVFSKVPGAQAAPTAGLHFTPEVLGQLRTRGVEIQEITLSVSSGTFRTVDVEDITRYKMDPEYYTVSAEAAQAIQKAKEDGRRVIAVGTTVTKTLETVARKQGGQMVADSAWSELFIYPGFDFQVVDGLLTNFHLPKSTLMMLVSAFASRSLVGKAYREALDRQYRFYSYGDCMLIV